MGTHLEPKAVCVFDKMKAKMQDRMDGEKESS